MISINFMNQSGKRLGCALGCYVVVALLLSSFTSQVDAALNLDAHSVENHIVNLRRQIFVEKKYLREPDVKECSSLGGPNCFAMFGTSKAKQTSVDGVIPERLLKDLHGRMNLTEFVTPSYDEIEFLRRQVAGDDMTDTVGGGGSDRLSFGAAKSKTEVGYLHFGDLDLKPKTLLFAQFSRGLPAATIASWEGKWLIRDCSKEDRTWAPVLPPPDWPALSPPAGALVSAHSGSPDMPAEGSKTIMTTAQIHSTVGYIRFSRPVVVRSLFARWNAPPQKKASQALQAPPPPAIISGRLGFDRMWTTHLDPNRATGHWLDIGGGPLSAIDEVVFIAAVGLEVGFLEVVARGDTSEYASRTVLMLTPTRKEHMPVANLEEDARTKAPFTMHVQALSPASAAFVASLQEVIDNDLDLVAEPAGDLLALQRNSAPVAGIISSSQLTQFLPDPNEEDLAWHIQAAQNEQMLDHAGLPQLMTYRSPKIPKSLQLQLGLKAHSDSDNENAHGESPIWRMMKEGAQKNSGLPEDLRRTMKKRKDDIVNAANAWVRDGGSWRTNITSVLPQYSDEDAIRKYLTAKRWQNDLDHLTAAMLYLGRKAKVDTLSRFPSFIQGSLSGEASQNAGVAEAAGLHMVDILSLFGSNVMEQLSNMQVEFVF